MHSSEGRGLPAMAPPYPTKKEGRDVGKGSAITDGHLYSHPESFDWELRYRGRRVKERTRM